MNYNKLHKYSIIDGFIVMVANIIAVAIPVLFDSDGSYSYDRKMYYQFTNSKAELLKILTAICFLIPLILCSIYTHPKDKSKYPQRFINTPLVFGLIGVTGWILSLMSNIVLLFCAKKLVNIHISRILSHDIVFTSLSAFLTFTISFFTIEIGHRKFILPKFFPEGHFSRYTCIMKPSFKTVSFLVYISSCIFPLIVLLALYTSLYSSNPNPIYLKRLMMVILLTITGLLVHIGFTSYFATPIKKLKEGADQIKNGNYEHKIDFLSIDELGDLTDTFNDMSRSLLEKNQKISAIQNSIIKGMAMMVESRDNSTGGHINRTSAYVQLFARHLFSTGKYPLITEEFISNVIKAAPMHDLGKIAVDDAILRKPGKFTDEEYEKMKAHAPEGARIVANVLNEVDDIEFKTIAINVAHYHHEKWNGCGYPEKISGTDIPLEARIMALADVYDALVSKRCYKDQFSFDKAFDIIEESSGSHFDPDLAKEFLACRPELEELTYVLSE